jgi:hypothetical protein
MDNAAYERLHDRVGRYVKKIRESIDRDWESRASKSVDQRLEDLEKNLEITLHVALMPYRVILQMGAITTPEQIDELFDALESESEGY